MGPVGPLMTVTWRRLRREMVAEAFSTDFRGEVEDRFGDAVPWKTAQGILKHHGVPDHVYRDEADQYGLPPWGSSTVPTDALLQFLGY